MCERTSQSADPVPEASSIGIERVSELFHSEWNFKSLALACTIFEAIQVQAQAQQAHRHSRAGQVAVDWSESVRRHGHGEAVWVGAVAWLRGMRT